MTVEQSARSDLRLRPAPDRVPTEGLGTALAMALPMLGSVGAIVLVAGTSRATGGRGLVAAVLFGLATLGFVVVQVGRQRRLRGDRVGAARQEYLHHLRDMRRSLRSAAEQQRVAALADHPPPATLPCLLERGAVRARTPTGPAYLHVRVGCGPGAAAHPPLPPPETTGPVDVACAEAARRLVAAHRQVPGLPVVVDLAGARVLRIAGPPDDARDTARAVVCSAAAAHSPADLRTAVLCDADLLAAWDWVKWLPHAAAPRAADAAGPGRLVATTLADLIPAGALREGHGHLLLVTDGVPSPDLSGIRGVTELRVAGSANDADATLPSGRPGEPWHPAADRLDPGTAEACARRLAAGPAVARTGADDTPQLTELLRLPDPGTIDAGLLWRDRAPRDRLRVPIGRDEAGEPVLLDLKESAEGGMGPHGLVVGATGSGKSELLRTLVLGLAATHSPDDLALVLVDFKGGATFAGLAPLPHATAAITNLEDDLSLIDRMQDALAGELVRRQELLRDAGGLASLREYRRAREGRADLPPLPSLLVVVDEFSELLAARPELLELFVTIGRLGRSLGVHLLLASQRLEEGRLRGLETHLSYRIGLRTFSAAESRTVLGVPDAHTLPNLPGLGYLRPGPSRLVRFRAAFVSSQAEVRPAPTRRPGSLVIAPFTVAHTPTPPASGCGSSPSPEAVQVGGHGARSALSAIVHALETAAPPVRRLWLPPLGTSPTLASLLPDLVEDPTLGLVSPRARAAGPLVVPLGMVDRPREQRHDVLTLDLSGADGHAAMVGGPRSGTTTLLHTLVCVLALTHSPDEVQVLIVDLGGSGAITLGDLPHVVGTAGRSDPERVRRLVAHVGTLVDRRERLFATRGVSDPAAHRATVREDTGRGTSDARTTDEPGDVVLVVDGWSGLRADFEDLEPVLESVARRGLAVGVHLVVGARRWAEIRPGLRDLLGTRLELRLGDPLDSEIDRRLAEAVPRGRPGRGLTAAGHHLLTALPVIDHSAPGSLSPAGGVAALVRRSAAAWPGPVPTRVRMLPPRVGLTELREDTATRAAAGGAAAEALLLGLAERDLAPVRLDPDTDPHLLVLGDAGSGRTGTLRTLTHEVARTRAPDQARLLVLDPRRTLLGDLPTGHTLDHLTGGAEAVSAIRDLTELLTARLPGPAVTASQLRERSWWQGADVWVVADDHDLLGSPGPLATLAPLLPRAADVGLHLVVARRATGTDRALHDPVLRTLLDTAQPALLLSASPAGGTLLGQRPRRLPPGRGTLVGRGQDARLVQVAWSEPGGGGPG